ncbi:S1C family serine protease [Salipaludibacillus daqingensis]|uniref:S1C family serine protease n=1 Tax=Salipaludibacillus daqingensis TaxID=3041001 RepID=UPI002474FAAC|nr:trypsin-like peptidase domain-containing protein [Salipaludibacillus daqingensis]
MFCRNCGVELVGYSDSCPNCRLKQPPSRMTYFVSVLLVLVLGIGLGLISMFAYDFYTTSEPVISTQVSEWKEINKESVTFAVPKFIEEREAPRHLPEVIAEAQHCVYTVRTYREQGSGFLYNEDGIIVTNAHVVAGMENATIITQNENEYEGEIIGFSERFDVAIIRVKEFEGREPFPIDVEEEYMTGEEIVALGSPSGVQNTATVGHITNTNRNLTINRYEYEDLYEISAKISKGSSGGPLLSQKNEKFIAINAAKSLADPSIGYSIPLYKIESLITEMIENEA